MSIYVGFFNITVILGIILVMVALYFTRRVNILGWMVIWWLAIYLVVSYGFNPPVPASIVVMFMMIVSIGLAAYLSASTANLQSAKESFIRFVTDRRYSIPLALMIIGLPALAAYKVYSDATQAPQPPIATRTIHPVPPTEITYQGKKIDLVNGENPYRKLEESDPAAFSNHVENGRRVYFQNCVFCHGDDMAGDGLFAHAFDPIPANFQDPTTIAMLQESYIFWRVAKGGPGLPDESTPWASAMPAWEKFLTEEEVWDVILFMYEYTGHKPRAKEEAH